MRLHTLIYSTSVSVPVLGLVYDPKIIAFMSFLNQDEYLYVDKLNNSMLNASADKILDNLENYKSSLTNQIADIKELAVYNASLAIKLLEENNG